MPLLPIRSSSQASADSPDGTLPADSPALFEGSEDTGNCWQTTLPFPVEPSCLDGRGSETHLIYPEDERPAADLHILNEHLLIAPESHHHQTGVTPCAGALDCQTSARRLR